MLVMRSLLYSGHWSSFYSCGVVVKDFLVTVVTDAAHVGSVS